MFSAFSGSAATWLVLMIVLLIVEAAAPGLVCIWFALGALAAMVSCLLGSPLWLQILWFALVSVLTLIFTRPLVKKYVNSRTQPTNADRVVGQKCLVTEPVDNLKGTGAVSVDGKVWTARSLYPQKTFDAGDTVTVIRIEGVKLIID